MLRFLMDAEPAGRAFTRWVRFLVAGDTAVVAEFGEIIERELSERVLRLSALIRATAVRGLLETVPTYRSLLVHYDPLVTDSASVITAIKNCWMTLAGEPKTHDCGAYPLLCVESRT